MRAIVSVLGKDQVGIVAKISTCLMNYNVNIDDISQNVLESIFNMIMYVDISNIKGSYNDLSASLEKIGDTVGLQVRIQKEEIFTAMHRI